MKNIECSDERGVEDNRSIIERISRWYKELENIVMVASEMASVAAQQ
ncbi:8369_t:CDS:2 [Rhizophagus irregularis]|nr:8369_t:CDS:2 [Rhizophagus irregularis]